MPYLSEEELGALGLRRLGRGVRISTKASIYNADEIEIGDHVRIDDFCVVSGRVKLGRNVHVSVFCNIAGGETGIELEDFVTLAYGCQIFAQSDDYSGRTLANPTIPSRFRAEIKQPVLLRRHVIVGTHSIVFPGVTVETGCSIGANTAVLQSTEPWGIYVGNPSRWLKPRARALLDLEEDYLASIADQSIE